MTELMPGFDSPRAVFCAIAWVSTLLAALMFVISFFVDFDGGGEVGAAGDGADTGMFSFRAIVGFFLGLGWGGYLCLQSGGSVLMAGSVGLGVGVIMFLLVAMLIRAICGLQADGNIPPESLVGRSGTVYVTIPPRGEPGGQVQVAHPNQLMTLPAVQEGDEPLPARTLIIVTAATPSQVTVKPLSK